MVERYSRLLGAAADGAPAAQAVAEVAAHGYAGLGHGNPPTNGPARP